MAEGKRRYDLVNGDSGTYIACVECQAIVTDPKEHDRAHELGDAVALGKAKRTGSS